jgi:hypothetical protein
LRFNFDGYFTPFFSCSIIHFNNYPFHDSYTLILAKIQRI